MRSIEWWHFHWPCRTPNSVSRSRHFWSRISKKNGVSYGQSYFGTL